MYLALSRLKVVTGKVAAFEAAWKNRKPNTHGVKGFKKFNLFIGNINKEFSIYIFIANGILRMILLTGQNQMYFRQPIKILPLKAIYILDHQILMDM